MVIQDTGFTAPFLLYVFADLLFLVGLLVAVAYFTLLERKVMASVQRRVGPNVVGFYGLLQPLIDGLKLPNKEIIVPQRANRFVFLLAPVLSFTVALLLWSILPLSLSAVIFNVDLSLLFVFLFLSLNVYGLLLAGWSSNSKYALLGALRSGAQVISYELVLGFIFVIVGLVSRSYNLLDFVVLQGLFVWFVSPLLPVFFIFPVVMLAETNRVPFDLAEAEAEIVAGYNVEYSSVVFAPFFLAEYSNMLAMSVLAVFLFPGGASSVVPFCSRFFIFLSKIACFLVFFVVVRAALPRYRYDQLMSLGWKTLLPFRLGYLLFLTGTILLSSLFFAWWV